MPKKHSPPKPHSAPKAFDVFKPGKALASPTSRPVIAGHKPAVRDSTVTGKPHKPMAKPRSNGELLDSHDKVAIPAPVAATASEPPAPQPAVSTESTTLPVEAELARPITQAAAELTASAESATPPITDEPEAPVGQEPEPAINMQTEEIAPPAPEQSESSPEVAPPDQEVAIPDEQPIVDPAQIVVSHHKPVGQSKLRGVFVILVIIALAAGAVDAVLDAGIWSPNFTIPHTHLLNR